MTPDPDAESRTTYRFRWTNVDLDRVAESRRAAASSLRKQAETLCRRADQIEEEVAEWQTALELCEATALELCKTDEP